MAGPAPVAPAEGDVEAPVEDFRDDASLEEAGRAVAPVIVVSPQQGGASGAPGEATSSPMARSGTRLAPLGSTAEERRARVVAPGEEEEKQPEGCGGAARSPSTGEATDGGGGRGGLGEGKQQQQQQRGGGVNNKDMKEMMAHAKMKKENHINDDDEAQHGMSVPLMVAMAKAKRAKDEEFKEKHKKEQLEKMLGAENEEQQTLLTALSGVAVANRTLERTARVLFRGADQGVRFTPKGALASPSERSRLLRGRLYRAYRSVAAHGYLKRRGWRGWYSRSRFNHRVATGRNVHEQGDFAGRGAQRVRNRAALALCAKFASMTFFNFIIAPSLPGQEKGATLANFKSLLSRSFPTHIG